MNEQTAVVMPDGRRGPQVEAQHFFVAVEVEKSGMPSLIESHISVEVGPFDACDIGNEIPKAHRMKALQFSENTVVTLSDFFSQRPRGEVTATGQSHADQAVALVLGNLQIGRAGDLFELVPSQRTRPGRGLRSRDLPVGYGQQLHDSVVNEKPR